MYMLYRRGLAIMSKLQPFDPYLQHFKMLFAFATHLPAVTEGCGVIGFVCCE